MLHRNKLTRCDIYQFDKLHLTRLTLILDKIFGQCFSGTSLLIFTTIPLYPPSDRSRCILRLEYPPDPVTDTLASIDVVLNMTMMQYESKMQFLTKSQSPNHFRRLAKNEGLQLLSVSL